MQPVLQVEGLTKAIKSRTLVDNISFEIGRGEVFGLLGPNGAGKTTTIRMLVGLARPSSGRIAIDGHDVQKDRSAAMKRVGTIVENPELYPYLSGLENLQQFARLSGNITEARIRDVVRLVGLEERIGDKVRRYSLGMRQRLGVAQALLHDPALLILDEPTNGLDPSGIREFRELLRSLAAQGTSILISSHLLAEIELVCDRVGVIQQGKWVTTATVHDLQQRSQQNRLILHVDRAELAHDTVWSVASDLQPVVEGPGLLSVDRPSGSLNALLGSLIKANIEILRIEEQSSTLEDVFLEMTGGNQRA
ncbi:ABC transporter ATP-binding protein [Tumebacillus sp. DT12]|uniref:ABC transporter ATP-binding protein n=1 Tax=Tumebacillus lacus TaxID=2995335 RepID=A0ABT3WVR6_9BACL|nr:ABC transporter ATP-binding protein [Tumebacillus lacus]MCX7568755.1 ABC transporter ATP-binding protein [Tumebacillus lacus]